MSEFWGMAPEPARTQAGRLRTASGELEDLRGRLDAAVSAAAWTGDDADAFRDLWATLAAQRLTAVVGELAALGDRLEGEADQQDVTSDRDGSGSGPAGRPSTIPDAPTGETDPGYRSADDPWLPNILEEPLEGAVSGLASVTSDAIGLGFDAGTDLLAGGLDLLGLRSEGIAQFQEDANGLGGILEDWATGERVPSISETVAALAVTAGSGGVGVYEAVTGEDTPLFDDRPGGHVFAVESSSAPQPSPDTLGDLIVRNNALRVSSVEGRAPQAGQIGIQEIHGAHGGEPVFIAQIPPTEADIGSTDAWGGQQNSRDWASNLRLVAGHHPAAMDDVRAAMAAADVPPGADVMFVGHSQGGIIASHLAADPTFNSDSGAAGTYDVTHSFSVGSPLQSVVPAQDGTEIVNVTHGPVGLDPQLGGDGATFTGDPISQSDLQGAQWGGGTVQSPNVHEVMLPGYEVPVSDGIGGIARNHESFVEGTDDYGYHPGVVSATGSDPVLAALQSDLTGVYLGDGTYVAESHVVDVGRRPH
ncbi:hypothetical protein [Brachybacterium vulturis]|uniref:WXG100 family type VII secretion target n=1 Tax=Brachybacterium vulturis TaxID=2017484 RepID=UPI003736759E